MTPGTDEETLDGFSRETIRTITQEMRTEQFQFKPVRQQFIPKPNGKMRKLGIPCVRDKIVQEVIHMILEAIYDSPQEPYFRNSSHGFRPNRSCHSALREFRGNWSSVNWLVEGDIRACFDELDFMSEVMQRIQEEFLHIINRESGFTVFYALQTGHDEMLTISVFATQAGAVGSTPLASEWVKQNLAGFIQREPETTVGRIFGSSFGSGSHEGLP